MSDFESILNSKVEEDVQRFLTAHPDILLRTFGKMVCIPKFKFGNAFVSDFVLLSVTSLGYHIDLVELEPPTERAFTAKGRYAKRLNDAVGQLNDWFAWISENKDFFMRTVVAEASDRADFLLYLHGGSWPIYVEGKIIIGRRGTLSDADDKRRRAIYLSSNQTIEITHYDRLLDIHEKLAELRTVSQTASRRVLARLASSRFPEVRQRVASRLRVSDKVLIKLAHDLVPDVVSALAKNEQVGDTVFRILAERGDKNVVRDLVCNPAVSGEILAFIFDTADIYIQRPILKHPNCPESILLTTVLNAEQPLRTVALENPNLADVSVLRTLAQDPSFSVRIRVARNPHLPNDVLAQLADDPHKQVRLAARFENRNSSEEILLRGLVEERDNPWAKRKIARHPNLAQISALTKLSEDEHYLVRMAVTENPNLPHDIRERLLHDSDSRVATAASRAVKIIRPA